MSSSIALYWMISSILTFIVYGLDKAKAIHKRRRISEKILLVLSLASGGLAALLAMFIFHHKTKKRFIVWNLFFGREPTFYYFRRYFAF